MHLHRQADRTVKVFDKYAEIVPVPQVFPLMLTQQFVKRFAVLPAQGDALQRVGMAGIDGVYGGTDPLLRLVSVHRLISEKVAEQLPAEIYPEHAVPAEKHRPVPRLSLVAHGVSSF